MTELKIITETFTVPPTGTILKTTINTKVRDHFIKTPTVYLLNEHNDGSRTYAITGVGFFTPKPEEIAYARIITGFDKNTDDIEQIPSLSPTDYPLEYYLFSLNSKESKAETEVIFLWHGRPSNPRNLKLFKNFIKLKHTPGYSVTPLRNDTYASRLYTREIKSIIPISKNTLEDDTHEYNYAVTLLGWDTANDAIDLMTYDIELEETETARNIPFPVNTTAGTNFERNKFIQIEILNKNIVNGKYVLKYIYGGVPV